MNTVFGTHLRHWRKARGISQLDLGLIAGVSARHLSFLETGRSRPGQELVLRLAEALDIPLRYRNELLTSVGLATHYPEARLSDESLAPFRDIINQILAHHMPYPGFVLDKWWNVVQTNEAADRLFLNGQDSDNSSLHVLDWLARTEVKSMISNWEETMWAAVHRLGREVQESGGDPILRDLHTKAMKMVASIPMPDPEYLDNPVLCTNLLVPNQDGTIQQLSVVSTVARFGTTREITMDELRVELVFPANSLTRAFFESN